MGAKRRTTRFGGRAGRANRSSVREASGSRRVRPLKKPSTDPSRERAGRTLCAACPQLLVALPEVRPVASFLNPSGRDSRSLQSERYVFARPRAVVLGECPRSARRL